MRQNLLDCFCVQPENVPASDADTVKARLKKISNAVTSEEVSRAVVEFETSPQFTSNKRLSSWFHNKWKPLLTVPAVHINMRRSYVGIDWKELCGTAT
jgi:hypothetical protein